MAEKRTKLKKSMGPGSIWAVAVGSIIGWGCFIQGGLWTQRAGGPLPLFLGFLKTPEHFMYPVWLLDFWQHFAMPCIRFLVHYYFEDIIIL